MTMVQTQVEMTLVQTGEVFRGPRVGYVLEQTRDGFAEWEQ